MSPRRSRGALAGLGGAGAVTIALLAPSPAVAHALGSAFTLPVPLWLYLAGAGVAVAASFVVSVLIVKRPADTPRYPTRAVQPELAAATGTVLRLVGLAWWFGAIASGWLLGGDTLLPAVLFWFGIWVAVPMTAALLGNPWPSLSPFRTIFDALDGLVRSATRGRRLDLGIRLPNLGRAPAVVLLLVFLLMELVWPDRLDATSIANVLAVYTAVTLIGMVLFGSVVWLRSFELFEILNGWFGRVGPVGRRTRATDLCAECSERCDPTHCVDCAECTAARDSGDQETELRWWVTGLTERSRGTGWGDAAVIVLALAGVTFDGLQETPLGGVTLGALYPPLSAILGPLAASYLTPTLVLLGVFGLFMTVFGVAAALTRRVGVGRPAAARPGVAATAPLAEVAGAYAPTLLPIAAGYLVAHYLTLVLQAIIWLPALIGDPLALAPTLELIPTQVIWYLSVGAIVGGHVAAVALAHRLALRDQSVRPILAGLPLVVVMIGYTVLSLWIIAQPIVIEPA